MDFFAPLWGIPYLLLLGNRTIKPAPPHSSTARVHFWFKVADARTAETLRHPVPRRLTEKVSQESVTSEPNNASQNDHCAAGYRGEGNKGRGE